MNISVIKDDYALCIDDFDQFFLQGSLRSKNYTYIDIYIYYNEKFMELDETKKMEIENNNVDNYFYMEMVEQLP